VADVPDYVTYLLNHERDVGSMLGVNIMGMAREPYVVNLMTLTLFGWLVKVLVDRGVLTQAQLDATMQIALNGTWPDWVVNQHDPNTPPPV
jgi:hypothetical protein